MSDLFSHWLRYLESNQGILGLILVAAGISFLFTGWRFGRASLVFAFAIVGTIIGCRIGFLSMNLGWFALAGASIAAGIGLVTVRFGGAILGGLLGGWAMWSVLENSQLPIPVVLIIVALAALCVGGITVMHKRETTIVLTSLLGAAIFVSGLIALIAESHRLESHYRDIAT
jgi:hypothetical protein